MVVQGDLWICGGTVVDPARGISCPSDVLLRAGKVVDVPDGAVIKAKKKIDASGLIVVPGLIDFHAHVFYGGTGIGIAPDSSCLPQGVTTVVDQGSAGINKFAAFYQSVIMPSQMHVLAYLHVSSGGLTTLPQTLENADPAAFDAEKIATILARYSECLLGLKIRQSLEIVGSWGLKPLEAVLRISENLPAHPPVVVHTTNAPAASDEIAELLRPGDIFAHVYQGKGNGILDAHGRVLAGVSKARERGVLFDTADGRGHYAFSVARSALRDGFAPDILSTDAVRASVYDSSVFGMPLILSKYLNLGMPLEAVIKCGTAIPAHSLHMDGRLGTLAPGAEADVALFRLQNMEYTLTDVFGETLDCHKLLVPQLTVCGGTVAYRNVEFLY